jgi:extracellular factor (EF) 3-hydroxypalmitic acid methyl ester biosynthesis protein
MHREIVLTRVNGSPVNTGTADEGSWVVFANNLGLETRASLLRLTQHAVIFEIYSPSALVRMSEVLADFKVFIRDSLAYNGRAVVSNLVNTGSMLVCEVTLGEAWVNTEVIAEQIVPGRYQAAFDGFLGEWQKYYSILPEYKVSIADIQTFFCELRLWLDQVELGVRSNPSADRLQLEKSIAEELGAFTTPAITTLFEKFEQVAKLVESEMQPAHRVFAKRQLHPILLCSPFLYRTFQKPLGYAGDYEMVNMLTRDPIEGSSLFAKIINLWFLRQAPAEAHRNRISYLSQQIAECTATAIAAGRKARILSLGCGPAVEVQEFIRDKHFADKAEFFLLDFNEETLAHAGAALSSISSRQGRSPTVHFIKKSVNQILKEAGKQINRGGDTQYDFVYCAGLFDYLSDQLCQRVSEILYQWVAPGGLFVSTNVDSSNPRRLTMDFIMEWHLIYRTGAQLASLKPSSVKAGEFNVKSDLTGVNVYFEARKPSHG